MRPRSWQVALRIRVHGEFSTVTLASARNRTIKGASERHGTDVEALRQLCLRVHPDRKCALADAFGLERETGRNAS